MPAGALYSCYDFRLRSELPLGELTPAGEADAGALVEVRIGSLPVRLASAAIGGALQASADEALLTVDGVGRFLVRGGREIVVEPAPEASERNVRLFLLGSALGILCHQRGLLPLHANAVLIDGAAVAFAGPSGIGKSTLAAYFARAGYPVLCDDVCVVGFDAAGRPHAWPGLPRLKLWREAALAFGHEPATLDRAVDGFDKFQLPLSQEGERRSARLRRVYLLARAEADTPAAIVRLRGHRAMEAVMAQTYRHEYLAPMGLTAKNFSHCAALLAATEVYEARRAWGYDVFESEVRALEAHMRAGG